MSDEQEPAVNRIDGSTYKKITFEDVGTCFGGTFDHIHLNNASATNCGALIKSPAVGDLQLNGFKWSDTAPKNVEKKVSRVGWSRVLERRWKDIFGND